MTEYAIVQRADARQFVEECKTYLLQGWAPLGGVAVVHGSSRSYGGAVNVELLYTQAFGKMGPTS